MQPQPLTLLQRNGHGGSVVFDANLAASAASVAAATIETLNQRDALATARRRRQQF